jgi:hypothetical protein
MIRQIYASLLTAGQRIVLCSAAWAKIMRVRSGNSRAIASDSPVLSQKASSRILAVLLLCVFLVDCGGSSTPTVTTITVTSAESSIAVSGTASFTATAKDQNGNVMIGISFAWASSAPGVATVNASSGVALGLLPGTAQITASASGVTSGPAILTVTPGFLPSGSMNMARSDSTATLLNNGMVLIAGGFNASDLFLTSAELYNPSTGAFTPTGSLNTARRLFTVTLLQNGMVLIAAGAGATNPLEPLASAELYDPATGTFTPTGSLNDAHRQTTATLLDNGTVLISGGITTNVTLASAELYDPVTGTFTLTGSLNIARNYHTATLLNNGMVLIAGGENVNDSMPIALAGAELYDPATGIFTTTGSLNFAPVGTTATLLNDGTVLLAGGTVFNDSTGVPLDVPLSSAEIYDSATGTFAVTGSLNTARVTQTATLLPNGTTLVAGGFGASGPLSSAELYEP